MRPKTPLEVHSGLYRTQVQLASGSSNLKKPLAELAASCISHPAFNNESSQTEYTSSSCEEAVNEKGICFELKPKDTPRSQDQPIQAPYENLALLPKSHNKPRNLVNSERELSRRSPSLKDGVLDEEAVLHRSFSMQRVQHKHTSMKERHEIDTNGKVIVVVDLGDSDEEADALLRRQPLCTSCQKYMQHKQHELQTPKAAEKDEVHIPKVTLVVDLSATPSQVNHAYAAAGEVPRPQKGEIFFSIMTPSLSKGNGKQIEADMDFNRDHVKTVSVKANGKKLEAEMDFSKEKLKTVSLKGIGNRIDPKSKVSKEHGNSVTESPPKLCSRISFSSEVLKASIDKVREAVLPTVEESEDEASTLSEDYRRGDAEGHHVEMIPPDWSLGVLCDLCERGASLSLGAWYSWCCGNPSLGCSCSSDDLQRKKKALMGKGGKNRKTNDPPYPWSGKVHKLCGLWSAEVFEDSKHPWRIMKLGDAVRRSRKIKCSDLDCGLFGATLGCRVTSCKRSFHYPCADRLSASLKVRMWDGLMKPVACKEHRHVNDLLDDVKLLKESKKRKRGRKSLLSSLGAGSSKVGMRISDGVDVIQIQSAEKERSPHGTTVQDLICRWNIPHSPDPLVTFTKTVDASDSWLRGRNAGPAYFGKNLLCLDFSGGLELIEVPCTNDVDNEPPPYLEYITKSRYEGQPLGSRNCSHPLLERRAKACNGCALHDPDDPLAPPSVHIPFQIRENDFREDWLRERMHGRLPYDKYSRLVIGTDYNELVECNDRCTCGDHCINREMQKGLRTPIELYKTVNKGWAVRTLVPIPRGRFVIEYVGEMLTQDQAHRYGQIYDEIKRSYLYDLDYPESKRMPDFTLDGFHASNVARFINHSCDANLKIYRVYVETTYKWLSHIGMYAMRDIEAGEELSYDYNYGRPDWKSNNPGTGKQKMEPGNDSRHIKCCCGAKNCREWLWRPTQIGEDSEVEKEE